MRLGLWYQSCEGWKSSWGTPSWSGGNSYAGNLRSGMVAMPDVTSGWLATTSTTAKKWKYKPTSCCYFGTSQCPCPCPAASATSNDRLQCANSARVMCACKPIISCQGKPGTNDCLIGGTCYKAGQKDSAGCNVCDPAKTATAWSPVPNTCFIGGKCYVQNQKATAGCQVCDPGKSTTSWSPINCAKLKPFRIAYSYSKNQSGQEYVRYIYSTGGAAKSAGLGQVQVDYSCRVSMAGRTSQVQPYTGDEPQVLSVPHRPVLLPNGKGRVNYFCELSGKTRYNGFMLTRPDGSLEVLYRAAKGTVKALSYYLSVSDDGKWLGAMNTSKKRPVLMRTDKGVFANGKRYLELAMTPSPKVLSSVTLTLKHVLAVTAAGHSASTTHTLWRGPVDGSKPFAAILFPLVNAKPHVHISSRVAYSSDGGTVAVVAGAYQTADIITVGPAGKAVNVSKDPGHYIGATQTWGGTNTLGTTLALSVTGKHVAYVKYITSKWYELYVSKTDGSGTIHTVTTAPTFSALQKQFSNLRWIDDDNLLFTARGKESKHQDIFRYQVSTATTTNITKHGDPTKPFSLCCGNMKTQGMFLSPNDKWFYYLAGGSIRAVDLQTWAVKGVKSSAWLFEPCSSKPITFFTASYSKPQLYMLELNTAKVTKLTNITKAPNGASTWQITRIKPSADCTSVAVVSGSSSYWDVHAVDLSKTPPLATNVTKTTTAVAAQYIEPYLGISSDNSQVYYVGGTTGSKSMRRGMVNGCCAAKPITPGAKYWHYYGNN